MTVFFPDKQFHYQTLRLLGEASSGASEAGEVLATASQIENGSFPSWASGWEALAQRLRAGAEEARARGRKVSAGQAFLRASASFRAAGFYLHEDPSDPRTAAWAGAALDCYRSFLTLSGLEVEAVLVPWNGTTLPAWFHRAPGAGPRPVLVAMTGYDGTKEELHGLARAAVDRGFHCLAFEGPGQGEVILGQGIPFLLEYETVVGALVDFLSGRPEADPRRIVLWGESFGGFLAPRAAAFEHRLAACVANGGVFDFMGFRRPPHLSRTEYFASIRADRAGADQASRDMMASRPELRWAISHGMYVFGADSPSDYLLKTEPYCLEGVADLIRCPTLVVDVEHEPFFPGQARELFDRLTCPKDFLLFTAAEGAGDHCQVGARNLAQARIFDWIETVLENRG